jgi:LemA protein
MNMDDSIWSLLGLALLVFWLVGAYNRLVRLRADVNQSFAALGAQLDQYSGLVSSWAMSGQDLSALQTLLATVHTLDGALHDCQGRLHQAELLKALGAAVAEFDQHWQRLGEGSEAAADKQRLSQDVERLRGLYNDAAALYNAAVAQFPALLLARALSFKPVHAL